MALPLPTLWLSLRDLADQSNLLIPFEDGWSGALAIPGALVTNLSDVDGEGGKGDGFEVHRTAPVVGAEDGTEEAATQVEAFHVGLEIELDRLRGEIAEDNEGRGQRGDVLGPANPREHVLIVMVQGDIDAVGDGGVSMAEGAELAIPVQERGLICVLDWNAGR